MMKNNLKLMHDYDNKSYILGSSEEEFNRLDIQSVVFQGETLNTLKLAGIKPGMTCVDLGCGTGDVTRLIGDLKSAVTEGWLDSI